MATASIETIEPFARLRNGVGKMFDDYCDQIEPHYQWLDEILGEAKTAFQKPDVELLPKTPSEKRKRGRPAKYSSGHVTKTPRQSSTGRKSRHSPAVALAKAAILTLAEDSSIFSEENQSTAETTPEKIESVELSLPVVPPPIIEELENVEEEEDAIQDERNHMEQANAYQLEEVAVVQVKRESSDIIVYNVTEKAESTVELVVKNEDEKPDLRTPELGKQKAPTASASVLPKFSLAVYGSTAKDKLTTPSALTPRLTPSRQINRLTPKKSAVKESQVEAQKTARKEQYNKQLEDAAAKREDILKQKIEEQKKKREERMYKVAQVRLKQKAAEEELKRKIEEKYQTPSSPALEEKRKLRPRIFDSGAKRQENERKEWQEREREKEKERIQREQDEMRRLELIKREQQEYQQKLPPLSQAASKQSTSKAEPIQYIPSTQPKNPSVFEPKKESIVKLATAASASKGNNSLLKPNRGTYNLSNTSAVANKSVIDQSAVAESYDMTPLREVKPATATNYDISDLRSSDETDDEENPRKKIPGWAQGGQLRMALTQQYYKPPNLNELFGVVEMPDLTKMFTIQRRRFIKRTSSAKWESPIRPHESK